MKSSVASLGNFIDEISERLGKSRKTVYSVTNDRGFVPSLEVFDKQVYSVDISAYKIVRQKDLAYNPSRINVGSIAICNDPNGGAVSPMYVIVRCRTGLLPEYMLYFLKSPIGLSEINHRTEGAVRFQLKFKDLQRITVYLPPLSEQHRIVRILDEADELRKLRQEADKKTAELIPAIFYEMFMDSGRNENRWEVVTLGQIGGAGQYGLNAASTAEGKGIRFIRITDIDERGQLRNQEPAYVPMDLTNLDKYELREGDVLIARSGATAGKSYLHVPLPFRAVFAGYLIRFNIDQSRALPLYVASFLQTADYWRQLRSHKRIAAQPNVNAKELSSLRLPLPPLDLQKVFAARVKQVRAMENKQANSRKKLDELFNSLLDRAFKGEL